MRRRPVRTLCSRGRILSCDGHYAYFHPFIRRPFSIIFLAGRSASCKLSLCLRWEKPLRARSSLINGRRPAKCLSRHYGRHRSARERTRAHAFFWSRPVFPARAFADDSDTCGPAAPVRVFQRITGRSSSSMTRCGRPAVIATAVRRIPRARISTSRGVCT